MLSTREDLERKTLWPPSRPPTVSLVLLEVGPPQSTRHVGILLNVLAGREDGPQLAEEGPVVTVVQLAELGRDGVGSLLGPVEGNATGICQLVRVKRQMFLAVGQGSREKMVDNVVIDNVVEKYTADPAEVTVNRGEGSLDKGPSLSFVVVNLGVVVVEVGDGHKPVVNPEVRHEVQQGNSLPPNDSAGEIEGAENETQAQVGVGNVQGLVGAEDGRGGLEVAHAPPAHVLALHAVLAGSGVGQEVRLPASQLVEEELEHLDDWHILEELGVQVQVGQSLAGALLDGLGDKSHVLLHVAGEAVVTVVAVLPGEVRHEQRRVHEPAHEVVEALVDREGAVAALVSQNPDTRENQALNIAVGDPGGSAPHLVLNLGDVGQSSPAETKGQGVVAEDIAHGPRRGGLETVGRNPAFDGVDIREFLLLGLRRQLLGLKLDGS